MAVNAKDLHGVMAMMPCFATPNANDINAKNTIAVDNLTKGVDKMIKDGVNFIVTTGTFGEFHTLYMDEYQTLARATVEAAKKRVPIFIGCIDTNARNYVERLKIIQDSGADGALLGAPCYIPGTVDNTVDFFGQLADMFPKLSFMIYHNPEFHRVRLPVEAFKKITQHKNFVGMKDSHRSTAEFQELIDIVKGKISIFPHERMYHPFHGMGASGCWSISAWMGPEPIFALRDAVESGDLALATRINIELGESYGPPVPLIWRETGSKLTIKECGYVDPGPLRPPFYNWDEKLLKIVKDRAVAWNKLRVKYAYAVKGSKAAAE